MVSGPGGGSACAGSKPECRRGSPGRFPGGGGPAGALPDARAIVAPWRSAIRPPIVGAAGGNDVGDRPGAGRYHADAGPVVLRRPGTQPPSEPLLAAAAAGGGDRVGRGGERLGGHRDRGDDRRPADAPDPGDRAGRRGKPAPVPAAAHHRRGRRRGAELAAGPVRALPGSGGHQQPGSCPGHAATGRLGGRPGHRSGWLGRAGPVRYLRQAARGGHRDLAGAAAGRSRPDPGVRRPRQALGALLLFTTNVAAILASGIVLMALYRRTSPAQQGPGPALHRVCAVAIIAGLMLAVLVPLWINSDQINKTAIRQSDVQAVAGHWAAAAGWSVVGVTAKGEQVLIEATGPNPAPSLARLRRELDDAGLDGLDVRVSLVPASYKPLPGWAPAARFCGCAVLLAGGQGRPPRLGRTLPARAGHQRPPERAQLRRDHPRAGHQPGPGAAAVPPRIPGRRPEMPYAL